MAEEWVILDSLDRQHTIDIKEALDVIKTSSLTTVKQQARIDTLLVQIKRKEDQGAIKEAQLTVEKDKVSFWKNLFKGLVAGDIAVIILLILL